MPNKPQRTPEQQEYRDKLAHDLKELRKYGDAGRDLAQTLLDKEQATNEYIKALGEGRKLNKEKSKQIAEKLIETGDGRTVVDNLEKFEGLDVEILVKLLEQGYWREVVENLDKFEGLEDKDYKGLAYCLIGGTRELGHGYGIDKVLGNLKLHEELMAIFGHETPTGMLVKNLDKFKGLDRKVAIGLIEARYSRIVIKNLDKFEGLKLDREIALKMVEHGDCEVVFDNLDKFEGLKLDKEIALKIIGKGEPHKREYNVLSKKLDKFEGLDEEVADKLIKIRYGNSVMDNIDKFSGMNYKILLHKLLNGYLWKGGMVGEGPERHCRYGGLIIQNLDKFEGLDHKWLVNELVDRGDYYDSEAVVKNLDKFDGLNHKEIASKIIKRGFGRVVIEYLENFKGEDHKEIMKYFINREKNLSYIELYINKIEGLDEEIAEKLIKAGYGDIVSKHPENFGLKKEK